MKKKNILAFLLAMVLTFGSFAETGITAMASESDASVETLVDAIRSEEENLPSEEEEGETTETTVEESEETTEESSTEAEEKKDETTDDATDVVESEPTVIETVATPVDAAELEDELEDAELEEEVEEENEAEGRVVKVNFSTNAVKVTARIGAEAKKAKYDTNGAAHFNIGEEDKLVVIVEALENSTITNATYVIGDTTKVLKAASKTSAEFVIAPASENSELTINTVENNVVEIDGNAVAKTGYNVKLGQAYNLHVHKGSAATDAITELKATRVVGKTTEDVTDKVVAEIKANGDATLKVNEELAGSTINLTINNKDAVKLIVEKKVVSASLAGVKGNTITLTAGVKKSFKVNVNAGADAKEVTVSVSGSNKISASVDNGVVTITPASVANEGYLMLNYKGETLATYTIKTDAKAFEKLKPVTKILSMDDTGANVRVSLPKGIKYENLTSDAYYVFGYVDVRAVNDDSLLDGDDAANYFGQIAAEIEGDSQELRLDFIKNGVGNGYAAKYYLFTFLCLKENRGSSTPAVSYADSITELYDKDALKVSTKKPAYATSLSLVGQKKSISYYETISEPVVIATAQFDKNATFRTIADVTCDNSDVTISVSDDGTKLLAKVNRTQNEPYTVNITAYADYPELTMPAKATMKLTVVGANPNWKFESVSSKLYKKDGVAATVKTKIYNNDYYNKVKYKSVSYKLFNYNGNEINSNFISVNKSGVVTVAKNYVVGAYESDTYYVKATVTNLNGLTSTIRTNYFTVEAKNTQIGEIQIGAYKESEYKEITGTELFGQTVYVYDTDGNTIYSTDYTITGKNLTIYKGEVLPTKLGPASITVALKDGSGSKRTVNFKVTPTSIPVTVGANDGNGNSVEFQKDTVNNIGVLYKGFTVLDADGDIIVSPDTYSITAKYGKLTSLSSKVDGIANYYDKIINEPIIGLELKIMLKNYYTYTAKTAEDVITVTNKSLPVDDPNRTVSFTIFNKDFSKVTSKETKLVGNGLVGEIKSTKSTSDNVVISGKLANLEEGYNYKVNVSLDMAELMNNFAKYDQARFEAFTVNVSKDSPEFSQTVSFSGGTPPAGTYKVSMIITKSKDGEEPVIFKQQMVNLTIKGKPVVKVNVPATVKIAGADKGAKSMVAISLTNGTLYKTSNNPALINANINGEANKFTENFKVVSEVDDKGNTVYYLESLKPTSEMAAKDLVGYIAVLYTDKYGNIAHDFKKITLKK